MELGVLVNFSKEGGLVCICLAAGCGVVLQAIKGTDINFKQETDFKMRRNKRFKNTSEEVSHESFFLGIFWGIILELIKSFCTNS